MYKIIGADGKEYGPIPLETMRQWIAEGRVNSQTRILPEGATEWRQVSDFPEFGSSMAAAPAPLTATPPAAGSAQEMVSGPAIGLMITSGLAALCQVASVVMHLVGFSLAGSQPGMPAWANAFSGTVGVLSALLGLVCSGIIFTGALKMKNLTNYGLAMAASILSMLPCSPCCLIGLPIGIWALVVLTKAEVKAAFH